VRLPPFGNSTPHAPFCFSRLSTHDCCCVSAEAPLSVYAMPKGGKGKGKKGKKGRKGSKAVGPILTLPKDIRDAANGGNVDAVQTWFASGGHVDATHSSPTYPDRGRTMLMIASRQGIVDFVRLLLQRGAVANQQDGNGCTALMFAAVHGNSLVVAELLLMGADPMVCNHAGKCALQWARDREHEACERLIQRAMLRREDLHVEERLLIKSGGWTPWARLLSLGPASPAKVLPNVPATDDGHIDTLVSLG
jgi:hypothetical protein